MFACWKKRDADRLAAELLTSYREVVVVHRKYKIQAQQAENRSDGVYELVRQTQGQLIQMQRALERLLGTDGAKHKIMELEQSLLHENGMDNASIHSRDQFASVLEEINLLSCGSANAVSSSSSQPPMDTSDDHDKRDNEGDDTRGVDATDDRVFGAILPTVNKANCLVDRKLVHELILNPRFQILRGQDMEASAAAVVAPEQSVAAMTLRVREVITKAFWGRVIMSNDIEILIAYTNELRTTFRDAVCGSGSGASSGFALSSLSDHVDNALHPDQLRELMQNPVIENIYAIQVRCTVVLDAIGRAEAPARAASTRSFRSDWAQRVAADPITSVQLLVSFLAFALDKVDELRIDVLNAHLGLLSAYLQRHGVEYEQKQLCSRLSKFESLDVHFAMTRKWLDMEMNAYVTRSDVDESERACLVRHDGSAYKRFLRASIWSLVVKYIDGAPSQIWPETFELDVERIRACRDAIDRIAVVSSLLALLHNYVIRRSLATPPQYMNDVGYQLSARLRPPEVSGAQLAAQAVEVVRHLEKSDGEVIEELHELEKRLLGSFAADNAVFQLFFSRCVAARQSNNG